MDQFKREIKQWVHIDDQLKQHNKEIKALREQKEQLKQNIQIYAEQNEFTTSTIAIPDGGKLKFTESKQTSPITLGFLKECLEECLERPEDIDHVLKHIKDTRPFKINKEIRRYEAK
jgi:TolA-binding protein